MRTRLGAVRHINILTTNLDRALAFYTHILGFQYVKNLGPDKVVLDAGGFDFFLERVDEVSHNEKFHFGMKANCDDLRAFADTLEENGIPLTKGNNPAPEVFTTPDGQRTALYFKDPDGWEIEVYTDI